MHTLTLIPNLNLNPKPSSNPNPEGCVGYSKLCLFEHRISFTY